jgi:hypothetical protein
MISETILAHVLEMTEVRQKEFQLVLGNLVIHRLPRQFDLRPEDPLHRLIAEDPAIAILHRFVIEMKDMFHQRSKYGSGVPTRRSISRWLELAAKPHTSLYAWVVYMDNRSNAFSAFCSYGEKNRLLQRKSYK